MWTTDISKLLHRSAKANKYDFGHVLIIGGSPGMVGAPLLTAEACLRIGAGVVTIAANRDCVHDISGKIEEALTLELPQDTALAVRRISAYIHEHHVTTLAIGPGIKKAAHPLVRKLCTAIDLPLVIDAGGLQAFHGHLPVLQEIAAKNPYCILTPHTGEYQRLAHPTSDNLHMDARSFAQQYGVHVVLKGDHTYIAHPDGAEYTNSTGNPGLATAGTGDVLTGVIAGLLAQHFGASQACEAGVYIHGVAGDLAAAQKTQPGLIASDVIALIPTALRAMQSSAKLT